MTTRTLYSPLSALAVFLLLPASVPALEFALGFDGCPEEVTGMEGEVKSFDVFAVLTTTGDDSALGASAWSIGVEAVGGTITSIQVDGIHVSTIYDHDGNPATPPLDPFDFDLAGSRVKVAQLTTLPSAGAVSAILIDFISMHVLQPSGTARIARITVEATVPGDVTLRYADGLVGGGGPVPNEVRLVDGESVSPTLGSCAIRLRTSGCTGTPESPDCNEDGVADECQLSANDCDANGVPDGCDPDCDQNGLPDACDIAGGAPDVDADGIPDACEADCNENQSPDDFDVAQGSSLDCNTNGVPDECDVLPAFALAPPVETVPAEPSLSLIAADVDGDGGADLVTDRVSVILSHGDGTLGPEMMVGAGSSSHFPGGLVAGHIDGDGALDIALVFGLEVRVFYGNGDGTFAPPEDHSPGATLFALHGLALADMDRDGRLDLVTVNDDLVLETYTVSVLRNEGGRTFAAPEVFTGFFGPIPPAQFAPATIVAGDFDGDDDPDLAVSIPESESLTGVWLLRNGDDGSHGALGDLTRYAAGDIPRSLAAGDLDGDGRLDLATANELSADVSLLIGVGDGTFEPAVSLDPGGRPLAVAVADLDGNGALDLAVTLYDFVSGAALTVFRNLGGGDLLERRERHVLTSSRGLYSLAALDLDRDGKLDLAVGTTANLDTVCEGGFAILLNETGPGTSADTGRDGIPDECQEEETLFVRGDCDGDGFVGGSVTDPVFYLNWAFGGGTEPGCRAACDADGDGFVGGERDGPGLLPQLGVRRRPGAAGALPRLRPGHRGGRGDGLRRAARRLRRVVSSVAAPGMDPWLEHPALWPDVHVRFLAAI
jgi:hypothetical protein